MRRVLVDTSALVAIFATSGPEHVACNEIAIGLRQGAMATSWPVVTEAAYLLDRKGARPKVTGMLFDYLRHLEIVDLSQDDFRQWHLRFAARYADKAPQLADLTLLYLADELHAEAVFTLDRSDFSVFQPISGRTLRLLPE